jgi:hypothetical protein
MSSRFDGSQNCNNISNLQKTHADGQSKNIFNVCSLFENMRFLKNINIKNSLYVCTSHLHTVFYELEKTKSVFPVDPNRLQLLVHPLSLVHKSQLTFADFMYEQSVLRIFYRVISQHFVKSICAF